MAENAVSSAEPEGILLVADRSPDEAELSQIQRRHQRVRLSLLDLSPDERVDVGVLPIDRLRIDDLLDLDRLHREFLDWLDRWPRETLVEGQPFDDLFRHTTGDSLWWLGPGSMRHPFSGPLFPFLKAVFLLRTACEQIQPSLIVVITGNHRLATILGSFSENMNRPIEFLRGSARPLPRPGRFGRCLWFAGTSLSLVALPVWIVIRTVFARLMTRPRRRTGSGAPSIVMSGWYPNHVRDDDTGRPQVWYWRQLTEALRERHPEVAVRYLLHTTTFRFEGPKRVLQPLHTGWQRLRHVEGVLPLTQTPSGLQAFLSGAARQWRLMHAYRRFEATREFDRSLSFAGADVSCLLVGPLRSAVASVAKWSRNVAATAASLKCAGDVRAVLVHEEFYPKGMLTIAAARSLRIPTMGVQHGAIGPQHTVYMPPAGQITGTPTPDSFAAYGDYAAEILSEHGAYPRERICVVGAPRLDELVTSPPDRAPVRRLFDWPKTDPVVLLTTETFPLSGPIYRALIEIARVHPKWHVVVKLHPLDRQPDAYRRVLASADVSNVELCRDRLLERLAGCDVLVTGYSTTAMEGLLLGKPVICADFTTAPDRYPFVSEGVAHSARSGEELRAAIERALHAPPDAEQRRKFLQRHLGPTVEGAGAHTFAALIGEMLLP